MTISARVRLNVLKTALQVITWCKNKDLCTHATLTHDSDVSLILSASNERHLKPAAFKAGDRGGGMKTVTFTIIITLLDDK